MGVSDGRLHKTIYRLVYIEKYIDYIVTIVPAQLVYSLMCFSRSMRLSSLMKITNCFAESGVQCGVLSAKRPSVLLQQIQLLLLRFCFSFAFGGWGIGCKTHPRVTYMFTLVY